MKIEVREQIGMVGINAQFSTQELIVIAEMVDKFRGVIADKVKGSKFRDNTIIVESNDLKRLVHFVGRLSQGVKSMTVVEDELFGVVGEDGVVRGVVGKVVESEVEDGRKFRRWKGDRDESVFEDVELNRLPLEKITPKVVT